MPIKSTLSFFVAVFIGLATSPAYAGDIISCDSFESCPALPTDEILALEARIEALETLLAGTTRGVDPSTSQDTLTFGNSTSSETVVIRKLSTTDKEGTLPVCFNGAGELLPCADGVEPPPQANLEGLWSGRMIYDRNYAGSSTCYDADVFFNVKTNSRGFDGVLSITVNRDSGGLSVYSFSGEGKSIINMYLAETISIFAVPMDVILRFENYGYADGIWSEQTGGCYGEWSFTKD